MRATWPTARKSESEPGASAGARLRNRSGRQPDEPVVAPFFVDAAPLMPHVLPPPGLPMSLPRELQGSGAAYSGGACRPLSLRRMGAAILCGEGMRGGPPVRRNMRAAEYFSPVPFAAAALLFPNPFSPRFLPPSSSLRRLGAALLHGEGMRGGPSARRNVRAAECFSPVPSAATALLFPVPVRAARFFGKKMRWGEINAIFAPKSSEA